MKILICGLAILSAGALWAAQPIEDTILAMERRAMDAWLEGNPDEFLRISDPEVTFFHSTMDRRLEGLPAVRALYESYRGRPLFDRYAMVDPKVAASGDVAVLTYELTTQNGSLVRCWHATEVYRRGSAGWRIIHSHFSQAGAAS